jgi:hypothetical protein
MKIYKKKIIVRRNLQECSLFFSEDRQITTTKSLIFVITENLQEYSLFFPEDIPITTKKA